MARIGIDDQFWLEIVSVVAKLGDQDKAIGNAVRWFRFAQEKHKHGRLVSEDEFQVNGFSEHLVPLFATRVAGGIKCIGAEKHFDWLQKKIDAGRKGGRSKSEAKVSKLKQNKAKASTTEASPSPSYSYSSSNSHSRLVNISSSEPPTPPDKILNSKIWEAYSLAYLDRYQTEPVRNAKVNGQVSQLAKRLGQEAVEVVRFFVGHNKSFYVGKLHDLGLCLVDAESLRTQWATGRTMTQRQAQQTDDAASMGDQLRRIREGKL